MDHPLIGIEVDLAATESGRRFAKCYESYFDAVSDAGGAPLLVPPSPAPLLRRALGALDGLVVPGGDDFHASDWGEDQRPCERFAPSDARRLKQGRLLIGLVDELQLPYLGVCYGMQLLNVVRGGALIQDIPDEVEQPLDHRGPAHGVEVSPGTLLARLVGAGTTHTVNTRHHQSVREAGRDLVVCARAPDGVIEAVEGPQERFLLGVQWHAEELGAATTGGPLFAGLVEAARARSLERVR
ncbi:MAG: gamma-glutamyl-gamma-aminobutyrate hydrolase family protein [Planctomycetes bacterium]|nr:gamma-glutamyl-gamma-aminobutyrate hydrolase family protein [Planctomycetota bacterium]